MGVAVRNRRRVVVIAAIGVAGCVAPPTASAGVPPPGASLLPDLVTLRPIDLRVTAGPHHIKLRLSNTIANRGAGPMEIYPEQTAGNDCDGDGDAADDRFAYQRVYEDSADPESTGFFVRDQDSGVVSEDEVGCMAYHPAHGHWHFRDFALYELRHEQSGKLAARSTDASGTKVSFCVIDNFLAFEVPGSIDEDVPFYPTGGAGCDETATEGLSVGYADVYVAGLPGQKITVDGLPRGRYCLISTADPVDRLDEANELNNSYRRRILFHPRKAYAERLPGACKLGV